MAEYNKTTFALTLILVCWLSGAFSECSSCRKRCRRNNPQPCGDDKYICKNDSAVRPVERCYFACREGWSYYAGSCYMFSESKEDYSTAESSCRQKGGYLADIDSNEENTFLFNLRASTGPVEDTFIGLTDRDEENTYVWVRTNESATFTFWNTDEPNNYDNEEHCIEMTPNGRWNDVWCDEIRHYFCEEVIKSKP